MTAFRSSKCLPDPESTAELAARLGVALRAGDVVLLEGDIGSGKTHFARALIQSLQSVPEDVPSPTFTLIQTYDTTFGTILHADLYRLTSPEELAEIGLIEAFETAICLIEWPDRLGADTPPGSLRLTFSPVDSSESARRIEITAADEKWQDRLKGSLT